MIRRAIVLAPHTDDGEISSGGTIAKMLEDGKVVYYVAFSSCEKSLSVGCPADTLKKELAEAIQVLGIEADKLIMLNYPVRDFPEYRQSILDDLVKISKEIEPDLVLMPSINDIHQDHRTVAHEALRAFKKTSILGYELPWNNYTFRNQVFCKLERRHIDIKVDAIKRYVSQSKREYMCEDYIRSIAKVHGVQIGGEYAEVFETERWIFD